MSWHKRMSAGEVIFRAGNYALITVFVLTIVLPFVHILALSFNNGNDAARGGIGLIPRKLSLENYVEVFSDSYILNSYKITFLRVVIGTSVSVLLTSMAAYALKVRTLPGRKLASAMLLFTMLFSGGIVPYYLMLKGLGLTNTFWVYIVPFLYNAWNIFLMRTFFLTISESLEESAMLDGANHLQIFFRLILPLSKPILAVIALFNGVGHWNDWFSGTFYVSDKDLHPLQTVLRAMLMSAEALRKRMVIVTAQFSPQDARLSVTTESLKMATIIVATVPVVCLYPFIQRYFVQGVMIGSLKE